MQESHLRSILKATSWRMVGTIDTFILSWLITGKIHLAGAIAGTELITKIALFWLHERAWLKVSFGKTPMGKT